MQVVYSEVLGLGVTPGMSTASNPKRTAGTSRAAGTNGFRGTAVIACLLAKSRKPARFYLNNGSYRWVR
jgi:hypothetical protein